MALNPRSPFLQSFIWGVSAVFALTVITPAGTRTQETNSRQDACRISQSLKPTKTVSGTYTDEATRKGVEGKVVLCATVDANGRVTDVSALSGPPELIQQSIDAAKQWQFEPPPKGPAATMIEMSYSLTKPCPDGSRGWVAGDIRSMSEQATLSRASRETL